MIDTKMVGVCLFALLLACAFLLSPWFLLWAAGMLLLNFWWAAGPK